jgi:hypothetical protein
VHLHEYVRSFTWGDNSRGQLGTGGFQSVVRPSVPAALRSKRFTSISAGAFHTFFLAGGRNAAALPASARLGSARLGSARLGSARLGSARLGSARLGGLVRAVRVSVCRPKNQKNQSSADRNGLRPTFRHGSPLLFSAAHAPAGGRPVPMLRRYPQLPAGVQQRAGRQRHMDCARYVQLGERHLHLLRAVDELARLLSGCQATRTPSLRLHMGRVDVDRAAEACRSVGAAAARTGAAGLDGGNPRHEMHRVRPGLS